MFTGLIIRQSYQFINNFPELLLCAINFLNGWFFLSRSVEILIESKFRLGMNVIRNFTAQGFVEIVK